MDEFTKKRLSNYAEQFVAVYTENEAGQPATAGSWAKENIPQEFMEEGSESLAYLQAQIKEKFNDAGWVVSQASVH